MSKPTPEQWWTQHAALLAGKMKQGGVRRFCVELNAAGNFSFEVLPVAPEPPPEDRPFHPQRGDRFTAPGGQVCEVIQVTADKQVHVEYHRPGENPERAVLPLEMFQARAQHSLCYGARFEPAAVQTGGQ